jgi:hypothetical protein
MRFKQFLEGFQEDFDDDEFEKDCDFYLDQLWIES